MKSQVITLDELERLRKENAELQELIKKHGITTPGFVHTNKACCCNIF
jgi:hypothetical protein